MYIYIYVCVITLFDFYKVQGQVSLAKRNAAQVVSWSLYPTSENCLVATMCLTMNSCTTTGEVPLPCFQDVYDMWGGIMSSGKPTELATSTASFL